MFTNMFKTYSGTHRLNELLRKIESLNVKYRWVNL